MKTAIGVDIGGTKISMVLGSERGKILAHRMLPTQVGSRARQGIRDLIANLRLLIAEAPVKKNKILGIGIGIPGPVDSRKGIVPRSPNLDGWGGVPLQKILKRELGLPAVLENDANAAALGEKIFGQAQRVENFVYITVSTGIGGGLVIHGKLIEGAGYVAGEVGHMTIVANGDRCKCGKHGCLEAYASGTAIARFAKEGIKKGKASKKFFALTKNFPLTAQAVGLAAQKGDAFALGIYKNAGFYLGIGVANILNILNPQLIILGGGVFKSAPAVFWKSMLTSCRRDAWPQAIASVKIVRSKLIRAGDLGALALAYEKLRRS